MAADPAPAPNPAVIDALNSCYVPILTFFEQAHVLEHTWEVRYHYCGLHDLYDCLVGEIRCWRRSILNRIIRLGGTVDARITTFPTTDDVGQAYRMTLDSLRGIFDALVAAEKACDDADDHISCKVLGQVMCEVDCKVARFEAGLRQIADLGPDYLLMMIRPYPRRPAGPTDPDSNPAPTYKV